MADDPSVYGSFMNFFLPQSARIPGMPTGGPPGLFDMLGGMGLSKWGDSASGTPEEQKKRQQQNMAMAQQGMKMLQPPTMPAMPADTSLPQRAPPPTLPPATQTMPAPVGYNMAGTGYPNPLRRPMMPPAYPFGR